MENWQGYTPKVLCIPPIIKITIIYMLPCVFLCVYEFTVSVWIQFIAHILYKLKQY